MTEKISVRLPQNLAKWLAEKANAESKTISAVIIEALKFYIKLDKQINEIKNYAYASALLSARPYAKNINKTESELIDEIINRLEKAGGQNANFQK